MKILVLGESESAGTQTGGVAWPSLMRDHLAAKLNEPVELEHTTFLATGERAPAIALKRVEEHQPDLVVTAVGTYLFATPFVWLRAQRLFGRRVGHWFRSTELAVDDATYGKGKVRSRFNSAVRWLAHRVIGGESITTREETTRTLEKTFRGLAQVEHLDVLAVTYGKPLAIHRDPKVLARRDRYFSEIGEIVKAHHFLWVDTVPEFDSLSADGVEVMQDDGLHGNLSSHEVMGRAAATAYLQALEERVR